VIEVIEMKVKILDAMANTPLWFFAIALTVVELYLGYVLYHSAYPMIGMGAIVCAIIVVALWLWHLVDLKIFFQ